jgi:hypothetical protein
MSGEKALFDEAELADILMNLSETIYDIQVSKPTKTEWDGLKKKLEKYLKNLREFARKHKAAQININASITWPPKIDVGLTFTVSD